MVEPEALLRRTYAAFNARDIEAVIATMHPAVDWPNALQGGRLCGHDAVRAYWTQQFAAISTHVEPRDFAVDSAGRVVVDVEQTARDLDGTLLFAGRVQHVYTLRDGLIVRMDVHEAPP